MASLKALKGRIDSVKSTQKITKAMQMVAAAKLKRAQNAAEAGRPYAERLEKVVASLASKVTISSTTPKLLSGTGKDQVHLFVVATSDKGLAGAFNANIARLARRRADALIKQGELMPVLPVVPNLDTLTSTPPPTHNWQHWLKQEIAKLKSISDPKT